MVHKLYLWTQQHLEKNLLWVLTFIWLTKTIYVFVLVGGVYDVKIINREEEGIFSCGSHSQRFQPLTDKELESRWHQRSLTSSSHFLC